MSRCETFGLGVGEGARSSQEMEPPAEQSWTNRVLCVSMTETPAEQSWTDQIVSASMRSLDTGLPAELATFQSRDTACRIPPILRAYMCSRSVFPIFLVIQWSPHPGPGFPTFAGIFEFAIRYFALERCFPFLAGTLFILLSLEVPRYQDTPSAQVLTGIIRSPLSKNLQRVLLRRDPFRHQPLPHLVFCFHIMLISSEFLRFERKCGRGWHHRQSFQSPPIHTG